MTHSKEIHSKSSSLDDLDSSLISNLPVSARHGRSTRVSLLVEALVRSLISVYETDRQKVKHTYKKICRRLFRMGLIDESWSMVELEGARMQFEHALFQLFCEGPTNSSSSPLILPDAYYTSQYKREFDEFEKIGGGAFGKVFRVKHKLDGTEYAVKKIPIQSEAIEAIESYISEVKTFASLNHPNIVQYKAAWLELGAPTECVRAIKNEPSWHKPEIVVTTSSNNENLLISEDISTSPDIGDSDMKSSKIISKDELQIHPKLVTVDTVLFPCDNQLSASSLTYKRSSSNSNFEIEFENDNNSIGNNITGCASPRKKSPPMEKAIVLSSHNQNGINKMPKVHWATLYIQMSLCHGTLQQWLRKRNESFNADLAVMASGAEALRTKAIQQILIQLLRGLKYIHSKGIVHHDIKPSNIFVSTESGSLLVQLGDFGLACPLQQTRHGFARGTPLYAAPEQLAGRCDPKSDMFSLGIVLFELIEDFGTEMERTVRISQLRSRRDPPIPADLTLSNLVSALVRHRSKERPDASTLLQALENAQSAPRPDVEALERSLKEKDEEIQRLKELLKKHGLKDDR